MDFSMLNQIKPNDEKILYWGEWVGNTTMSTSKPFSTCMFYFKGDTVSLTVAVGSEYGQMNLFLDGEWQGTIDCFRTKEDTETVFFKENLPYKSSHSLRIVCGHKHHIEATGTLIRLIGFETQEAVSYPAELFREMCLEYKEIASLERDWLKSEEWKPVSYKATCPTKGVSLLEGVIKDLFLQNISLIKYDYSIPEYCEGDGFEHFHGPGWSDFLPASNEARLLFGAGNSLACEEDAELRDILDSLIDKIEERMREDGYYNYYPEDDSYAATAAPVGYLNKGINGKLLESERKNYDRVFWTRGLIAAHKAGNTKALCLLRRMYDWFNVQEEHLKTILLGANATNGFPGGPLVYHTEVGKEEDIIINERFYRQNYWYTALREQQPLAFSHYPGERPHCYELLQLEALADEYRATGDSVIRDTLFGGYETYLKYYKHIGGATAICEGGGPYPPASYYITTGHNGETCGSIFWSWINERLMQLDPHTERYISEIEEAIFNIILSVRDEKGFTRYHNRLHGKKEVGLNGNTCCEVSSTGFIASIPQYIYMEAENELFVNLFIPSVYNGKDLSLCQKTDFPKGGSVRLTVTSNAEKEAKLWIRIPRWANAPITVAVNGEEAVTGEPGSYVAVSRVWSEGDTVSFKLPFIFKTVQYTGFDQSKKGSRYALMYGPLLMAVKGDFEEGYIPQINFKPTEFIKKLQPTDEPLVFVASGVEDLKFCPYYSIKEESFTCFPIMQDN